MGSNVINPLKTPTLLMDIVDNLLVIQPTQTQNKEIPPIKHPGSVFVPFYLLSIKDIYTLFFPKILGFSRPRETEAQERSYFIPSKIHVLSCNNTIHCY